MPGKEIRILKEEDNDLGEAALRNELQTVSESREPIHHLFIRTDFWKFIAGKFIIDFLEGNNPIEHIRVRSRDLRDESMDRFFTFCCMKALGQKDQIQGLIWDTSISSQESDIVVQALEATQANLTELCLRQRTSVDERCVENLAVAVSSMKSLKTLDLRLSSNFLLLSLMVGLSQEASFRMKTLKLRFWDFPRRDPEALPGLDIFLASNTATALENFSLEVDAISFRGMKRLVAGLSANSSIVDFELSINSYTDQDKLTALMDFFSGSSCCNIRKLYISSEDDNAECCAILPCLHTNQSLHELKLHTVHYACTNSLYELLKHNWHITNLTLQCFSGHYGTDIETSWCQSIADGLIHNETLAFLELDFAGFNRDMSRQINFCPLFSVLGSSVLSAPLHTFTLELDEPMHDDCCSSLKLALSSPYCKLKALNFRGAPFGPGELTQVMEGVVASQTLQHFLFEDGADGFGVEFWTAFLAQLPKLKLRSFVYRYYGEDEFNIWEIQNFRTVLSLQVKANTSLERMELRLNRNEQDHASFMAMLEPTLCRNKTVRACHAMKQPHEVGKLPVAAVPQVLRTIESFAIENENKSVLFATVLYAALPILSQTPEFVESLKVAADDNGH